MTQLTGQFPQNTYGDLLTTTNAGLGLSNTLQPLQDGLGNSSSIQIAQGATQFSNIMAVPVWATAARPAAPLAGTMGFNTNLAALELWNGNAWIPFLTSASPFIAKAWGYINPDGSLAAGAGVASTTLTVGNSYNILLASPLPNTNSNIVSGLRFTQGATRIFNLISHGLGNFTFVIQNEAGVRQTDTTTYFAIFGSG